MITLLMIFLAGIFDALIDKINFNFSTSIFSNIKNQNIQNWFNPAISWTFKYKNNDPSQGEKFLFSTTLLVCLTDGYHLFKTLLFLLLITSIFIYKPIFGIFDLLIFIVVFFGTFQLFYGSIFKK